MSLELHEIQEKIDFLKKNPNVFAIVRNHSGVRDLTDLRALNASALNRLKRYVDYYYGILTFLINPRKNPGRGRYLSSSHARNRDETCCNIIYTVRWRIPLIGPLSMAIPQPTIPSWFCLRQGDGHHRPSG